MIRMIAYAYGANRARPFSMEDLLSGSLGCLIHKLYGLAASSEPSDAHACNSTVFFTTESDARWELPRLRQLSAYQTVPDCFVVADQESLPGGIRWSAPPAPGRGNH
jgi:hypothetical protein